MSTCALTEHGVVKISKQSVKGKPNVLRYLSILEGSLFPCHKKLSYKTIISIMIPIGLSYISIDSDTTTHKQTFLVL